MNNAETNSIFAAHEAAVRVFSGSFGFIFGSFLLVLGHYITFAAAIQSAHAVRRVKLHKTGVLLREIIVFCAPRW
jgi:Mn2+/Fe2+ NRAMP family transporter